MKSFSEKVRSAKMRGEMEEAELRLLAQHSAGTYEGQVIRRALERSRNLAKKHANYRRQIRGQQAAISLRDHIARVHKDEISRLSMGRDYIYKRLGEVTIERDETALSRDRIVEERDRLQEELLALRQQNAELRRSLESTKTKASAVLRQYRG